MQTFQVVPGLLIGTTLAPSAQYLTIGVDAIIDLEEWEFAWVPPVPTGSIYLSFPMEDYEHVDPKVRDVAVFAASLVRSGRRVLVHCTEGLNRSGVVAARTLSSSAGRQRTPSHSFAGSEACQQMASRPCRTSGFVEWLQAEEGAAGQPPALH